MNNKLILIVEDEEDILELLEYTLQKEGYETIGFLTIDKNVKKVLDEEKIDINYRRHLLYIYTIHTAQSMYLCLQKKHEENLRAFILFILFFYPTIF